MATVEQQYVEHLQTLGIDATQIALDRKGTLAASSPGVDTVTSRLPRLAVAAKAQDTVDLVRHENIGRGGMGLVWAGTQSALRRPVAVKELIADDSEHTHAQLLREAIITGAIEHPNVVPVHLLGRNEAGRPLLVMKRIEGTPWRDLLQPLYTPDGPADPAVIDRQLHIFGQVCNAIDFAHSRGVLHRDLKPDNVMVGSFGEVYVLDWGIARVTDPTLGLPDLVKKAELVGTPAYMAPEMAAADPEATDVRTDVYLLGAVLHELLVGRRRHEADGVIATLAAAYRSEPFPYEPWVPDELAEICNRATHPDPARRFQDVRSLREAVEGFLLHRASRDLAEQAVAKLRELTAVLGEEGRAQTMDAVEIHGLASEARFGLEQSLAQWQGNEEARDHLRRLLTLMIEYEIGNDNLRAAKAMLKELEELGSPAPELQQKIRLAEIAARKRRQEIKALERMRAEGDISVHAAGRLRVSWIYGIVLGVVIGGLGVLRVLGLNEIGYPEALGLGLLFVAMTLDTRRRYQNVGNLADRRIIDAIVANAVLAVLSFGLTWQAGVSFTVGLAVLMYTVGVGTAMMTIFVARGLLPPAVVFMATGSLVLLFPVWRGVVMGLGCLVGFAFTARAWKRIETEPRQRAARMMHQTDERLRRSQLASSSSSRSAPPP